MTAPEMDGGWQPSEQELHRRKQRSARNRKNAVIAALSSIIVLGTLLIVLVNSPVWLSLRDTFFKWAYGV